MRIFSKRTLREFWEEEPRSRQHLETWYVSVKTAQWEKPTDVKGFYAAASILKGSRVVFNIKGNDYILVAKINYEKGWLFIRFIGSHADYDQIDAETI